MKSRDNNCETTRTCVIAVGGYSGSGKTTLIEKVLPVLKAEGLYVGVVKQTGHHRLDLDRQGKDTDRFFLAGAEFVMAHDLSQGFARYPHAGEGLQDVLARIPSGIDLLLVEGFRDCLIPGIWLEKGKAEGKRGPESRSHRHMLYRDEPGYIEAFLSYIHSRIGRFQEARSLRAGLLVGGRSIRMGTPKALMKIGGETLVERSLRTLSAAVSDSLLLGRGEIPPSLHSVRQLPDVPGLTGPMAGMLSAFRWDPVSAWLISAVDLPQMSREAWQWLLDQRRPGVWAVLPRIGTREAVETTGGCYEPMIFDYIESLAEKGSLRLQEIRRHPKVLTPRVPDLLAHAWDNVNTVDDWKKTVAKTQAGPYRS